MIKFRQEMNREHLAPRGARHRQAGLSLIELMITVALGSFILLGLTTLASSGSRNEAELSRTAAQLDNARYALQIMADDIRLAGFYGATFDQGTPSAAALALCRTPTAAIIEDDMTLPVVGLNNNSADDPAGSTGCDLEDSLADTDVISIRRTESRSFTPAAITANGADDNTWYLQGHPTADVDIALGDANANTNFNNTFNTGDEAPVRRFLNHTYYVREGAACGGAGNSPTLRRVVLNANGAYENEIIAEGVENMQIQYGMDTDDDGAANNYGIPADEDDWASVVTVRIHLLVRNAEASTGYSDTKNYNLGGVAVAGDGSACKKNVYTTTVNVVNVSNRRGTVSGS